ncbi:multicopper oxidase family protein [Streptosporangium subroseum]|uniref:multicopper oxidase family protein n=1 Tax=Streptosporangium subroseum TaxID=106412 RepID=UPI003439CAF9
MTTAQLLALDTIVLALVAGCWLGGGVAAVLAGRDRSPRTARIAAGLVVAALVCTALRVALTVGLAGAGWWFAADKLLLALPLVVVPGLVAAVISLPRLVRLAPGGAAVAGPILIAGYGGLGGVAAALTVSYPVSPVAAGVITGLVAGASVPTWRMLSGHPPSRRWSAAGGTAVLCFAVVWAGGAVWSSRLPDRLNLSAHHGSGAVAVPGHSGTGALPGRQVSVTDLRESAAAERPARSFTLTARPADITLASGRVVRAWTFDGRVPGPTIRVRQGELVEVRLRNQMPDLAVTLHWHGYHVPAGDDGVAGVTQDAVRPGGEFVYRFRATDPGSYWYHSHDMANPAVRMGLFGMFVVDPVDPADTGGAAGDKDATGRAALSDHTVVLHTLGVAGTVAVDDQVPADGLARLRVAPGTPVRLRVAATDNVPRTLGLSGVPYRLTAVDGRDLTRPGRLDDRRLRLAAGGRYDLTFTMPSRPVLLSVDGRDDLGLLVTGGEGAAPPPARGPVLDITSYGQAAPSSTGPFDREITWVLDRRFALLDGVPMLAHTVNGRVWPDIETPVVREGELIRITVVNRGRDTHPMHPHGHHVLVLSRDGRPVTTGPLWMDTFDVGPGEVWEVALRADNPGIWMSHCHDLGHASLGMTFHLAYEGITTPFDAGRASGNHPE